MSNLEPNLDPNWQNRDPRLDPAGPVDRPVRSWTLGVGILVIVLIVGFLALGRNHSGDIAATTPPGVPTAANPQPSGMAAPAASPTLPSPRNPAETTGGAPRQ